MTALISRERALLNINQSTFTAAEYVTIDNLIDAVSQAAERFTRTGFALSSHDEVHLCNDLELLVLDEYPIHEVHAVATSPTAVLHVTNSDTATNQRATVQVTTEGLKLVRVASGTMSIDESVTFASNTTLTAVVSAIDALGNGWDASLPDSGYANWPSAELRPVQGALNARGVHAAIRHHVEELSEFEVDTRRGWLMPSGLEMWSGEYRVRYTAGYDPIPEDVQEAVAEWVASLYWQSKDNPASYPSTPPQGVTSLLERYKKVRL